MSPQTSVGDTGCTLATASQYNVDPLGGLRFGRSEMSVRVVERPFFGGRAPSSVLGK